MRADEPALTVPIALANQVEAQVIGEHGVSQVFLWSAARIAGVPIGKLIEARGESLDGVRKKIEDSVRYANITIIEGNDASQFGIGIVAARITEMVLRDERAVVPIGSFNKNFGVTLSLPSVVGRGGVIRSFEPEMSGEERQALQAGAANLRKSENRTAVSDHHDLRLPVAAHRQRWSTQAFGCSPRSCARDG